MSLHRSFARRLLAPVLDRVDARAAAQAGLAADRVSAETHQMLDGLAADVAALRIEMQQLATDRLSVFVPPIAQLEGSVTDPFMQTSTCSSADFRHPRFAELCASIGLAPSFHRKLWEFVFILHHLGASGVLEPGRRGLGFGVGREPLPAAFAAAGAAIVATDAPSDLAFDGGWTESLQHALDAGCLVNDGLCGDEEFRRLVSYRPVDMNCIDEDLTGFDFCWSSCCFEHLGSIRHGLDFVIASVEQCLKPGGVAVHTTEYNLSSNVETLESVGLSLFRRRDLEHLVDELNSRGHDVVPFTVAADTHYLDQVVDLPPYRGEPHLKLELAGYTATSAGLVVRRGM